MNHETPIEYESRVKELEQKLESKESELRMMIQAHCIETGELEQKLTESEKKVTSLAFHENNVRAVCRQFSDENLTLKQKLSEALEVIRFYAREKSWDNGDLITVDAIIDCSDMEQIESHNGKYDCGGMRAREFLKKHDNKPSSAETI